MFLKKKGNFLCLQMKVELVRGLVSVMDWMFLFPHDSYTEVLRHKHDGSRIFGT